MQRVGWVESQELVVEASAGGKDADFREEGGGDEGTGEEIGIVLQDDTVESEGVRNGLHAVGG